MIDDNAPDIDVAAVMRRIRDGVSASRVPAGQGSRYGKGNSDWTSMEDVNERDLVLPRIPETGESIAAKPRYDLNDFLCFHDENFVRNAYLGVLRREPDVAGYSSFLSRLRAGELAKTDVLGRLRYSAEGRRVGVRIRGLPFAFSLRLAKSVPVVGRLLGIMQYAVRLPDLARNHERFEAYLAQLQTENSRRFNAVIATIEQELSGIRRNMLRTNDLLRVRQWFDDLAIHVEELRSAHQAQESRISESETLAAHERAEARSIAAEHGTTIDAHAGQLDNLRMLLARVEEAKSDRAELAQRADAGDRAIRELALILTALKLDAKRVSDLRDADLAYVEAWNKKIEHTLATIETRIRQQDFESSERYSRLAHDLQSIESSSSTLPAESDSALLTTDHRLDTLYTDLEDRFRGTEADIKQRAVGYLPVVIQSGAGTLDAPVLDIGCGRGEWLQLLSENQLTARGVDSNRAMVEHSRALGFDVVEGDAINYLQQLPATSVGAVTGIHIIEHVPFRRLVTLLDETLRVLKPGGVAIFETPNPENVVVSACSFYTDPTHLHPLPPQLTQFLLEARGFAKVEIRRLGNLAEGIPEPFRKGDTLEKFNPFIHALRHNFFSPPDYAVIATK